MSISEAYANFVLFPSLWSTVIVHIKLWKDLERLSSASTLMCLGSYLFPVFQADPLIWKNWVMTPESISRIAALRVFPTQL